MGSVLDVSMRSAAWLPRGENSQRRIREMAINGLRWRASWVKIVLLNVRLLRSCSRRPMLEPRSSFQDAILYTTRPTIIEKAMGKNVAACDT